MKIMFICTLALIYLYYWSLRRYNNFVRRNLCIFPGVPERVSLENLPMTSGIKTHGMTMSVNIVLLNWYPTTIKYSPIRLNMTMLRIWFMASLKFKNQFKILAINTIIERSRNIFNSVFFILNVFELNGYEWGCLPSRITSPAVCRPGLPRSAPWSWCGRQ